MDDHRPIKFYISYSSRNAAEREYARRISTLLKKGGMGAFFDQDDVDLSVVLEKHLEANIADADAMILIWSREASGSDWVRKEIDHFIQFSRNKEDLPILIVRMDDSDLPSDLLRFTYVNANQETPDAATLELLVRGVLRTAVRRAKRLQSELSRARVLASRRAVAAIAAGAMAMLTIVGATFSYKVSSDAAADEAKNFAEQLDDMMRQRTADESACEKRVDQTAFSIELGCSRIVQLAADRGVTVDAPMSRLVRVVQESFEALHASDRSADPYLQFSVTIQTFDRESGCLDVRYRSNETKETSYRRSCPDEPKLPWIEAVGPRLGNCVYDSGLVSSTTDPGYCKFESTPQTAAVICGRFGAYRAPTSGVVCVSASKKVEFGEPDVGLIKVATTAAPYTIVRTLQVAAVP